MPDAHGNFKGLALGDKGREAWERIFGQPAQPEKSRDEQIEDYIAALERAMSEAAD